MSQRSGGGSVVGPVAIVVAYWGSILVGVVCGYDHAELAGRLAVAIWIVGIGVFFLEPWISDRKRRAAPPTTPHGPQGRPEESLQSATRDSALSPRLIHALADELWFSERDRLFRVLTSELDCLMRLSPERFEDAVAEMFSSMGFSVKRTPASNDSGVDIAMTKEGQSHVVQCKRYSRSNAVGRPQVQAFVGAMLGAGADKGSFVTTSSFTKSAVSYAQGIGLDIDLIDGSRLVEMMRGALPEVSEPITVSVICDECGETLTMDLNETACECPNGHVVTNRLHKSVYDHMLNRCRLECPQCGKRLRLVQGRRGRFWGCTGYPSCHYTRREIDGEDRIGLRM